MRRVLVPSRPALAAVLLLVPTLAACGDEESAAADAGSVSVSGEVGESVEVSYQDTPLTRDETEVTVLEKGDGEPLAEGDSAFVHLYIGNGFSGEDAYSSYTEKPAQPSIVTVTEGSTIPALHDALAGQTVGSRVQVVATPEDAYGETGNPDLYIGNADTVVFVVDILSPVLDGVEGTEQEVPKGLPEIVEEDGVVSSLDFTGAGKPSDDLEVITLIEGDGPEIEKGSWLAMNYLGQVHGKKKPFDENYSAEQIQPFQIGVGELIEAWDKGLPGVRTGSRVMLVVPPEQGYGAKGNKAAGIDGTDTLVFVIDVLGVA